MRRGHGWVGPQMEIAQVSLPPEKPGLIDPGNCESAYRFGEISSRTTACKDES